MEIVSAELEKLMHQHLDQGNEQEAIEVADQLKPSWKGFEKLANTRKLSEAGIVSIMNKLLSRPDQLKSFIFEISHNLPQGMSPASLNNLAYLSKDSDYVLNNVTSHPNWLVTEPFLTLQSAREFWREMYEKSQDPSAIALLKSMATGKSETLKSPKGEDGSSDKMVSFIPSIKGYAKALHAEILKDPSIHKIENGAEVYIPLFKPMFGASAKMIKDAVLSDREGLNKIVMPIFEVSSWFYDFDKAKEIASEEPTSVILSKLFSLDCVLFSTDHRVVHGANHENLDKEMVILIPEGKIELNANDISVRSEDGQFNPHGADDVLKSEDLQKNVKKFAGALAAASIMGLPSYTTQHSEIANRPVQSVQSPQKEDKIEPHPQLNIIKQIETSGGLNLEHKTMESGMHAGHSAIGNYGLMPIVAIETVRKNPHLRNKYPDIANADYKQNHEYVRDFILKNPNAENEIANAHWRRLGHRFDNDESKMAHAWFNGITGTLRSSPEDIENHFYVKRYHKYKNLLGLEDERQPAQERTEKAEEKLKGITSFSSLYPEDSNVGKMVNSMINQGYVHDLSNAGHFTHSSIVAGNDPSNMWLVKVEPTNSPAVASAKGGLQSVKEAAFYDLATTSFDIDGKFFPRAILGEVDKNGQKIPAVAVHMLDNSYIPAAEFYKKNKHALLSILFPLIKNGQMHKIGAMYFILGEADAHGQNVLTDGQDIKLIDHGTSFADERFDPAKDDNIFIPYFFRAGRIQEHQSAEDKYSNMPLIQDARIRQDLKHWILNLDPSDIIARLQKYGINENPVIERLHLLKDLVIKSERPDDVINKLWTLGVQDENK